MLQPEIYSIKKEMAKTHNKQGISIFTDLHGHSQKKHCFMYGCNKLSQGGLNVWTQSRLIPRIMASKSKFFRNEDCRFKVTEDRMSTARVVAWHELKINNSFTLETSFHGYQDSENPEKIKQFTTADLESIGTGLALTFLEYTLIFETINESSEQPNAPSASGVNLNSSPKKKLPHQQPTQQTLPREINFSKGNYQGISQQQINNSSVS